VTILFTILALALVIAQFSLPKRLAFLPLILAVVHFQNVPVFNIGVAFSATKLIVLAGLIRAKTEGRFVWSSNQKTDLWILIWAVFAVFTAFFHQPKFVNPFTQRLSLVYDVFGSYLYARAFIKSHDDFIRFLKCLAYAILPLVVLIGVEKFAHTNIYYLMGDIQQGVAIREGRVRASGSFSHPILMGTYGATSFLLLVGLLRVDRKSLKWGLAASAAVVFCSASSGPLMTLFSGLMVMGLWKFRESVGWIRRVVLFTVALLHIVMQAPVWYLMARIDLAGGSTGWHRAELITAAVNHLHEWWLIGTDVTRHWMPYGVEWNAEHIDITNHYIYMGVTGGVFLIFAYVMIILKAFEALGKKMTALRKLKDPSEFTLWCVASVLFANCFTFISISYFDQSNAQLSMILGSIPALCKASKIVAASKTDNTSQKNPSTSEQSK